MRPVVFGSVVAVCLLVPGPGGSEAHAEPVSAFPGAEGFGRLSQGGRNGRIVEVVQLGDSGPGSLRACLLETGPRNCVFRVSGTIVLDQSLVVQGEAAGQLSILGQTAPGEGITITTRPDAEGFRRTPLILRSTHDVLLRHLRLRPQFPNTVKNVDALTVENSRRIYVDHVSGSWATDENINLEGATSDVTIAHSVFAEGLRPHSKCALLGSGSGVAQNISFWRNLCASNGDRNPDTNHRAGSCVEVTDNLFYNAGSEWTEVFSQEAGGTPISIVGNYFKAGPSTADLSYAIRWNDTNAVAPPRIFAHDNQSWAPPGKRIVDASENALPHFAAAPPCPLSAPSLGDAKRAFEDVVTAAGAFPRDGIDRRLVREAGRPGLPGTGKIRRGPGKIVQVEGQAAYEDLDGDGMADAVEQRFGAVPGVADAWAALDDEGRYPFDRFMEWLSRERIEGRYPG
ncbi:pectate lyase family protein [Aureimonas phyllosphaerae]|uniref:pectate lyase family protein n=1 Tax=Aureimonas phyllosphaerae TaxID=1166078 RepID=UPI003A5B9850